MRTGRPTIKDVADAAGVSKGAVSFAFNGRPGVSAATRVRILASAGELGYRPSATGRALSNSRSQAFGLVLARKPEMLRSDPFFPSFIAGVESVIGPAGQSLMLRFVGSAAIEKATYIELSRTNSVDGVFVTDLRMRDRRPGLLTSLGLPAITLNRPRGRSDLPAICQEAGRAIRDAVSHLIDLGHRRIAHVGGPGSYLHSADRRQQWSATLRAAGLPDGPFVESDFSAAGGAEATRAMLDLTERPSAILFGNDLMAVAGMSVAHSRGLRIPADLSVVGFDDAELSGHMHPPLSTIRTDAFGCGRAAATVLLAELSEPRVQQADVHLPPAEFIARGSTGPPGVAAGKGRRSVSGIRQIAPSTP